MESLRAQILCDKELGLGVSVANAEKRIRYPSAAKRAISVKMAQESVSEEMRVLYVAMTRARDRLIMTYASQTLESDLKDIVLRQDFDGGELVCQEATCMGDWVLLTALQRMEAGQLHALAGRPEALSISDSPWHIAVTQAGETAEASVKKQQEQAAVSPEVLSRIRRGLEFRYSHLAATETPSKQTATDLKGRMKDLEASEHTGQREVQRKWHRPSFVSPEFSGKEYGNVMHLVMQYISYERCADLDGIRAEIGRLVDRGFLTPEQTDMVDAKKLYGFFSSAIGKRIVGGTPYLREFKFSLLDAAERCDPTLQGEHILLQGVVDCALLEEDGITVIDFKTDYVTEATLADVVSRYRIQVQTYAKALERIYEQPVKGKYLYLFHLNRFVEV